MGPPTYPSMAVRHCGVGPVRRWAGRPADPALRQGVYLCTYSPLRGPVDGQRLRSALARARRRCWRSTPRCTASWGPPTAWRSSPARASLGPCLTGKAAVAAVSPSPRRPLPSCPHAVPAACNCAPAAWDWVHGRAGPMPVYSPANAASSNPPQARPQVRDAAVDGRHSLCLCCFWILCDIALHPPPVPVPVPSPPPCPEASSPPAI